MRLYLCIYVALGPVSVMSIMRPAFVGPSPAIRLSASQLGGSKAEDHLQEMTEGWAELEQKEKEIVKHPDEAAAFALAEEMLEKAIEYAHTKEEVEAEHIAAAHEALKKAIKQEDALEAMVTEARHDADDADVILDNYESGHLEEDREKRREMAVSDISHHVEDYVKTRIREAREKEVLAKEEEDAATLILEQLQKNEEELKATLKELKTMKKQQP